MMNENVEELDIPAPTTAASGQIKAIAQDTVHKICSGQVVLSLAVAVKELVENAIDAGATLVEIKLKEQGLQGVEVSDNGCGVQEANLKGMTAKYHTSKIREFVDLLGVETFGFRGEALSSLCALSDMTIVTRHASTDVALKIELDHDGRIRKRSPCARGIGTTVTLANLFNTLPVRRRDFTRNIKKEFSRMCQILQAYCLVTKGVRIICSNQSPKGAKSVVLQTHGAQDVLANITAVFGTKQAADLVPLKSPLEAGALTEEQLRADLQTANDAADTSCTQFSAEDVARLNQADFQLEGYISSCCHGAGRSTRDRQFFYVNARPCEPKNLAKVMNDVYHRYNVQQQPFIYLNVVTARSDVDVNLTPDKRQLLLNNEKILLLALKKSLLDTFGQLPNTYQLQNVSILSMLQPEVKQEQQQEEKEEQEQDKAAVEEELPLSSSQRFMDVLSQWRRTGDTKGVAPPAPAKRRCAETEEISARVLKLQKIDDFLSQETPSEKQIEAEEELIKTLPQETSPNSSIVSIKQLKLESLAYDEVVQARIDCKTPAKSQPKLKLIPVKTPAVIPAQSPPAIKSGSSPPSSDDELELPTRIEFDEEPVEDTTFNVATGELRTTLEEIRLSLATQEQQQAERQRACNLKRLRFKSEINPQQNQHAEAELQREINKQDFARMQIIGQFNLGFIIVKLEDDLFIVDQHAADEKYNFETLQRQTQLQHQPLTVPQPLELTAVNEMILMDHLEIFSKNGFKFDINEAAPATQKVRLLGKPYSKNWQFGKEDIDELIFMLQDAPEGTICRPSRIRAMFASRACRKSVMIGKALHRQTGMRRLITQLGEIEQPWNCPHGRPTMRHLINITMLMDEASPAPDT